MPKPAATYVGAGRYESVKQYADRNGISTQAIYAALRAARIRGIRIGNVWLIPVERSDAVKDEESTASLERDGSESQCNSTNKTST